MNLNSLNHTFLITGYGGYGGGYGGYGGGFYG
jgi:hypothetical protein